MRATLLIFPFLLTACATPREACIADVTRDARVLDKLIVETRGNLARGFAITEQQDLRTRRTTCSGEDEEGNEVRIACDETEVVTRDVPVAIDLDAERAKLASLEEPQRQNQINAKAAIAQCEARLPAES